MRTETVTNPPTLGAGRVTSWAFPMIAGGNVGAQATNRDAQGNRPGDIPNIGGIAGLNVVTTGAPPAGDGIQVYKNTLTYAITSNTVPTGRIVTPNFGTNQAFVLPFQNVRGSGDTTQADDYAVWSYSMIAAYDAIPGAITGDIGMTLGVGTRAEIRGTAAFAGIELGPSNTGVLSIIARQVDAGAITLNQVISNTLDMTLFHKYELRLLSATAIAEAQLKVLIDGAVLATFPWGAGTVLPDQSTGAAGMGFTPGYLNKNANAATTRIYVMNRGCTVCAAPTEDMLL